MNENRHPEIRWLDSSHGQETDIRFVGPLRLHNSLQKKTNQKTNMKQRYSRKLCLACLAFAGLTIVAIGLMSSGNLFANNGDDASLAADTSDARVGWIVPQTSVLKTSVSLTDSTAAAEATATDVENADNASQTATIPKTSGRPAKFEQLGLQIDNLDAAVASRLNLDGVSGVVITSVRSGSPAAKAGLQSGLVISQVNRMDVASNQDFVAAVADADLNQGILLLVQSANGSQFVVLQG